MLRKDPDDNELIDRILKGEVNIYRFLLNKYEPVVLRILKKRLPFEQVEEVAQVVFIKAYESLSSYRRQSCFKNWLSSIAIRSCYDFWRVRYKKKEVNISSIAEKDKEWLDKALLEQSFDVLAKKGQENEAREILEWAFNKLSPEDKIVLELIYLEGFSNKEASDLLGWGIAKVKVRSFRSRKKLEKILNLNY